MSDVEFLMALVIVVLGGALFTGLFTGIIHVVVVLDRWFSRNKHKE